MARPFPSRLPASLLAVVATAAMASAATVVVPATSVETERPGGGPWPDQVPIERVVWQHQEIAGWEKTSRVTRVSIDGERICIEHSRAGEWPARGDEVPVEGNPWIFARIDGEWHGGTFSWLRSGQVCKRPNPGSGGTSRIGLGVEREPLVSWVPSPGEPVGVAVSALARDARRTVSERSDIVVVPWPGPGETVDVTFPDPWTAGPDAELPGRGPDVHRTDVMTLGDDRLSFTHPQYAGYEADTRAEIRRRLLERGYTHHYLLVANKDPRYGQPVYDFTDDPETFASRLEELRNDGLHPVVWLMPAHAPELNELPPERVLERWRRIVPRIDGLVAGFCLGTESDEYWSAETEDRLGRALDELTDVPLFVHYTPAVWERALRPWIDGLLYQYADRSHSGIRRETREAAAGLHAAGKLLIADEYAWRVAESEARARGDVALAAGADGFANGAGFDAGRSPGAAAEERR